MKLRSRVQNKAKLSQTLKNWLPLLQCPLSDLETRLKEYTQTNPFCHIETLQSEELPDETHDDSHYDEEETYRSSFNEGGLIDSSLSLYAYLEQQITPPLFPTPHSQKIALSIIESLNEEGFFEGDLTQIAQELSVTTEEIERIRQRFAFLDPSGVGATTLKESFLFQLQDFSLDNELDELMRRMIEGMHTMGKFSKEKRFSEAKALFSRFHHPPAVAFLESSERIIPDIFIYEEQGNLKIQINDTFYPEIIIEESYGLEKDEFVKPKIKEAHDLIDALSMRKNTLYKIGLMIIDYQYDFFKGGPIRPLKLRDVAEDLGRNPSTVSRAISGKYVATHRGVYPIKAFFDHAVDDESMSSTAIKDYIKTLIKNENPLKALSDDKIALAIKEGLNIDIVRRTITKYREQMNIPTSAERKRMGAGLK